MICVACRTDLGRVERVGRRDTCPTCGVDLHSCRQCRFHDATAYNECRESQAERVLDKSRSNFCDWFAAADAAAAASAPPGTAKRAVPPRPAGSAREELDRLFRRK